MLQGDQISKQRLELLSKAPVPQADSPLYTKLPGEVRDHIFALALAEYPNPDPEKSYDTATCYTRPSYFAPRKRDTQLLQTCRAIYQECWHLPFTLREHTYWLTHANRAPPKFNPDNLGRSLDEIAKVQGTDEAEIDSLRVFAQMYVLEDGSLKKLLETPRLRPRSITLTIRHADWWFWENDDPLRFEAGWIKGVCEVLPESVREIHIELESLERKKEQINDIAQQMAERWAFRRPGGKKTLCADITAGAASQSRWSGTSTWHGRRWVRDETLEGQIDYYIATVSFLPADLIGRKGGKVSEAALKLAEESWPEKKLEEKLRLKVTGYSRIIGVRAPSIRVDP